MREDMNIYMNIQSDFLSACKIECIQKDKLIIDILYIEDMRYIYLSFRESVCHKILKINYHATYR